MKKQKSGLYRTKVKVGTNADGTPIVRWISGKTKRELEAARQRVLHVSPEPSAVLFGTYAVRWYDLRQNLSNSSKHNYRIMLNSHILPEFGERTLASIKASELQEFLNTFSGSCLSQITIALAALRGTYRLALQDGVIDRDPTAFLTRPKCTPPKEKPTLTPDQRARIERVCVTHPHGLYLAIMYYLGTRPGEALGLQWQDFDLDFTMVHVQRNYEISFDVIGPLKTKSSNRYIPIPDPLRALLLARLSFPPAPAPEEFLFPSNRSNLPIGRGAYTYMWKSLMQACDLSISPHTLRHNYITMCWENHIDVYATMKLVGHANYHTTMDIYTHMSASALTETAEQVNTMFKVAPPTE